MAAAPTEEVIGFSLVYSGDFIAQAEVDNFDVTREPFPIFSLSGRSIHPLIAFSRVTSFSPGFVKTDIFRNHRKVLHKLYKII